MRTTRPALASLVALAFALPALAVDTPAVDQWLVTSAKATGATGELFVTSLRIVNPGTAVANVTLSYFPRVNFDPGSNSAPGDNTAPATNHLAVPPGQTLQVEDVLLTLFGKTGPSDSGAIRLQSDTPVSVLSQTLVTNARSATGVPGTNGFAIPAQLVDNAVAAGDTGYVPYLSSAPDRTAGYRSNLFLFAANAASDTVVTVKLLKGSDGTTVGARDVTLGKMVQTQINDIGRVYGFTDLYTNLTAVLTVRSGGPVLAGASVIDNAISSQIYTPTTKSWLPNNGYFGMILHDGPGGGQQDYGFAGRLDILGGVPDFMTLPLVMDNCPPSPGPTIQLFFVQAFGSGANRNTTFTVNPDGTVSVSGSTKDASGTVDATITGTIRNNVDGTIYGTITYARSLGTAGGLCPGAQKDFPFFGARVVPVTP